MKLGLGTTVLLALFGAGLAYLAAHVVAWAWSLAGGVL